MVVFPVNFIIAFMFKRSRPRHKRPSRIGDAVKRMREQQKAAVAQSAYEKEYLYRNLGVQPSFDWKEQKNQSAVDATPLSRGDVVDVGGNSTKSSGSCDDVVKKKKFKAKKFTLPWWCVIIGWVLLWLTVVASVTVITFYGIMFQDEKCRKWITSMLISFVTSIFLTQPIKVVLLALLFSLLCKETADEDDDNDDENEEDPNLKSDEMWLHQPMSGTSTLLSHLILFSRFVIPILFLFLYSHIPFYFCLLFWQPLYPLLN